MFYYYGAKRRLAHLYPHPRGRTIVEPFAGSAAYAVHHALAGRVDRIVLVEKDPRVADLWRRLIAADPREIANYPIPDVGEDTDDLLVMTVATSNAVARSRRMKVSARMHKEARAMMRRIARELPVVAPLVEIVEGDYTVAPRLLDATYYVDPPYQPVRTWANSTANPKGQGYAAGCDAASVDYPALGRWVRDLPGYVIAVEQSGADWLPFWHLAAHSDSQGRSAAEVVWTNDEAQRPLSLF